MRRARRLMTVAAVALAAGYLGIAAFFFLVQRRIVFPAPPPRPVRVPGATLLEIGKAHALWLAGPADANVVVHFHGNAEQLDDLDGLAARWHALGFGFFAVEFPGYGASADRGPSESGAYDDGEAALAYLRETLHVPESHTILEGRSLGTGVATELAARGHGAKLILVSPYTSIADVGRGLLPFLPVKLLVRDRFDSLGKAERVRIPALVLHGRSDEVVPFALGEQLATALHAQLVPLPAGHDDALSSEQAWRALAGFVR